MLLPRDGCLTVRNGRRGVTEHAREGDRRHITYDSLRGEPSWPFYTTIKIVLDRLHWLAKRNSCANGFGAFHPLTGLAHCSRGVAGSPREDNNAPGCFSTRLDENKKKANAAALSNTSPRALALLDRRVGGNNPARGKQALSPHCFVTPLIEPTAAIRAESSYSRARTGEPRVTLIGRSAERD